ncbi:hypothetical protein SAMN05660657_01815 [Geodermatophilus amargosae]|uniref:Uncharacterized protein n=1 Tax=Geodermatophilus amargosae TaxID=1296565 RepID=A0A1I6ZD16_9ACTN|nr:hypothetical protein [Geodermatophilus amargosae]SFT60589.1 hypothetical protein SAMN05660657_01815 [Geodermatophilus amargosae]
MAALLLWPAVVVAGFLAVAVLVVVLGRSSTARYEFERNAARRPQPAGAPTPAAVEVRDAAPACADVPVPASPAAGPEAAEGAVATATPARTAVGLATHPAGRRLPGAGAPTAWWLVDGTGDRPEALAGPFADRVEADWAAVSCDLDGAVRTVHGVLTEDGSVSRRPSPQDRAWLAGLGTQLDRLSEDWDELLTDEDALTTLVVEVAAALVESGLTLHDCSGADPEAAAAGGVCLTPETSYGGVLVSWRQHDRMSLQQVRGAALDTSVQRTMNALLADLLAQFGFVVDPFGEEGCSLVTAIRTHPVGG